jgi:hypothetical protein
VLPFLGMVSRRAPVLFRSDPRQTDFVLPEGLEGGLVAGLAVVAVFLVRDLFAGDWIHTPTVLGTLILEGPEQARGVVSSPGVAAIYTLLHFSTWVMAGFATRFLVRRVEKHRADARILLAVWIAWVALSWLGLDAWIHDSGLVRTHLWAGGLAGAVAMGGFFAWRHPALWKRSTA